MKIKILPSESYGKRDFTIPGRTLHAYLPKLFSLAKKETHV